MQTTVSMLMVLTLAPYDEGTGRITAKARISEWTGGPHLLSIAILVALGSSANLVGFQKLAKECAVKKIMSYCSLTLVINGFFYGQRISSRNFAGGDFQAISGLGRC